MQLDYNSHENHVCVLLYYTETQCCIRDKKWILDWLPKLEFQVCQSLCDLDKLHNLTVV